MAVSESRAAMLRAVVLPALVGIPGGVLASLLTSRYPSRGYLSSEYYVGQAFELQVVILFAALLLMPLAHRESQQAGRSIRELCAGIGACALLASLIALAHGVAPVLLIFLLIWMWISLRWQRLELPAFRHGVWMCLGAICGAMAGAILHFQL